MAPHKENLPYGEQIDQKVFKEILDALTFIEPIFVSREEFNSLHGNILVSHPKKDELADKTDEKGYKVFKKDYLLYLPEDLSELESPSIIKRIDRLTFGNNLPEYSPTKELQLKILIAYKKLLENKQKYNYKKFKKTLSKYYTVYTQLGFSGSGLKSIESANKTIEYIESVIIQEKGKKLSEYEKQVLQNRIRLQLKEFEEEIRNDDNDYNKYLKDELEIHFLESFFERGVNNLRFGLKIMTQGEQALLTQKEWEDIALKNSVDLNKKEEVLREKIGIENYKRKLERARKNGSKEEIEKLEYEASSAIIRELYNNFPYQMTKEDYGSQPSKILISKQLHCIGFSIVGHAFLEELGIKHKGLGIAGGHSALEVDIGDKKYYFDATATYMLLEFKYGKKIGNMIKMEPIGGWVATDKNGNKEERFFQVQNTEKILFTQVLNNKGNSLKNLGKYKEAIQIYNKALKTDPSYYLLYNTKGLFFIKLGKYKLFNLNKYVCDLVVGNTRYGFEILYRKEKEKIKNFIKTKDFEGLRIYLLSLEEEN